MPVSVVCTGPGRRIRPAGQWRAGGRLHCRSRLAGADSERNSATRIPGRRDTDPADSSPGPTVPVHSGMPVMPLARSVTANESNLNGGILTLTVMIGIRRSQFPDHHPPESVPSLPTPDVHHVPSPPAPSPDAQQY
jgi:hypothetical protein